MRRNIYLRLFIVLAIWVSLPNISFSQQFYGRILAPGLIEKDWSQLSDHFASPVRMYAFNIKHGRGGWKHAESELFIYHYVNKSQLLKAYDESTFYLKAAYTDLQLKKMPGKYKKFHIWIFPNNKKWAEFCRYVDHNPGSSGFTTHSYREFYGNFVKLGRFGSGLLAHEIAHVVLGNFMNKDVPLWLNEGFANYEEDEAYARYKNVRVNSDYIRTNNRTVIPFFKLTKMTEYPTSGYGGNENPLFYNHSELLVRMIINSYGLKNFTNLVKLLGEGMSLENAMNKALGVKDIHAFAKRYEKAAHKRLR